MFVFRSPLVVRVLGVISDKVDALVPLERLIKAEKWFAPLRRFIRAESLKDDIN
jgi:hypothetical protein